ncbi:asparaginase domain-containing protein [archaeon]|nr:asparaginase domain-containing protein [archaeon]
MKTGDYIQIKTSKETFKGILMPDSVKNKFVLKLDSGYNIGINKSKIKEKKLIKKKTTKPTKTKTNKQKKSLKNILILHTGGTIASKVDYKTGGVIAKFTPEEILELYPEITDIANIKTKQVSNIFSEDMTFKDYNKLAREIKKAKGVEGIIITHGTDTMHYTSAALSFMLDNLSFPILLVGSQRSSDRGS